MKKLTAAIALTIAAATAVTAFSGCNIIRCYRVLGLQYHQKPSPLRQERADYRACDDRCGNNCSRNDSGGNHRTTDSRKADRSSGCNDPEARGKLEHFGISFSA